MSVSLDNNFTWRMTEDQNGSRINRDCVMNRADILKVLIIGQPNNCEMKSKR